MIKLISTYQKIIKIIKSSIVDFREIKTLIFQYRQLFIHKKTTLNKTIKAAKIKREIIEFLSSYLELNELKSASVTKIGQYFNADRCYIKFYDKNLKTFNKIDEYSEYLIDSSVKSLVNLNLNPKNLNKIIKSFKKEKIVAIKNVNIFLSKKNNSDHLKAFINEYGLVSAYYFPVLYNNELIATIVLHYVKEANILKIDDINLLKGICSHLGFAIKNSELFTKVKKHAQREELLRKIAETMRVSNNIKETINTIVTEIGKFVKADRCFIIDYDHKNKSFLSVQEYAEYRANDSEKSIVGFINKPHKNKYFYEVANKQSELVINDVDDYIDKNDQDQLYAYEYLKSLNVKTNIGLTIIHSNTLIGRLVIHYNKKQSFLEEELEFIKTLANHAGATIHQSQVVDEIKKNAKKEKLLRTVSEILKNDEDLEEKIFLINSNIASHFNINHVLFLKFNKLLTAPIAIREYRSDISILPFEKRRGLLSENIRNYWTNNCLIPLKTLAFNNLSFSTELPDYFKDYYDKTGVKSIVSVPFRLDEDRKICILLYSYDQNDFFNAEDLLLVEDIIRQMAVFLKEKAIYSQKVFLSNISHEIKTPLTLISGFAELLLAEKNNESSNSQEFLDSIVDNVKRVNNIIDNLLYISKLEEDAESGSIEAELCPINDVIDNVIYLISDKLTLKNLKLSFNYDKIYYSEINAVLIEQAILNLVENSIKYCNNNSTININLYENQEFNVISVNDESEGIEIDHLKNIFERFYRTDKSRSPDTGGTGLGLFIVKLIAKAHNGKIKAESEINIGSTFSLYLPKINNI